VLGVLLRVSKGGCKGGGGWDDEEEEDGENLHDGGGRWKATNIIRS